MKDFRDLKVWVKGHDLPLAVYRATMDFPREEIYGLISQLRRVRWNSICYWLGVSIIW
ncbi:MAG: four helix bundle protein [Sulfuricella denitrificans]|nr:four helix bundle protein [Sulfuricella denitrificans]